VVVCDRGGSIYIWVFSNHLVHLGRNDLAVLAPCCCALEDGDAFVHDGFEVLGFGVEGWDFGSGGHSYVCMELLGIVGVLWRRGVVLRLDVVGGTDGDGDG
jgi:hypothetical protein